MSTSTMTPLPQTHQPLTVTGQHDVDGIVRGLEDDGYAFMPNVLTREQCAQLRGVIDELDFPEYDGKGNGTGIDHHKVVFNRDPYWLQFIDMPGIIDAVEKLQGGDCHIIGMSAWRSPPGAGGWGMHVDQLFVPMDEELLLTKRVKLPVFLETLHFYLNDMDIDLCPTWVVPKSHLSGRGPTDKERTQQSGFTGGDQRSWNGNDAVPVLCNQGNALLFRSEVWHTGSKNVTKDRTRYLLQVHYGRRGMAQRFPPYLDFKYNPAVVAACNERQLRLIGKHKIGAYG
jgi:hypothetical protein